MPQVNHVSGARCFRMVIFCAGLPMGFGITIFTLWLVVDWGWLMGVGIFTIYGGCVSVALGFAALARYFWLVSRNADCDRKHIVWRVVGGAGLLLMNFPLAAGLTYAAAQIETCYTVDIENVSVQSLFDVRLFGGGCIEEIGTLGAHGKVRRRLWFNQDGVLKITANNGASRLDVIVEGYVTGCMGGHATVVVNVDGSATVSGRGKAVKGR